MGTPVISCVALLRNIDITDQAILDQECNKAVSLQVKRGRCLYNFKTRQA